MIRAGVWWDMLDHRRGRVYLAATDKGLCLLGLPGEGEAAFLVRLGRILPERPAERDPVRLAPYRREVGEYLDGRRRAFTLPLDLVGTPFQRRVWDALRAVPYGAVVTYAELARRVGRAGAARAVGAACRANPVPLVIPCHRVVGRSGALTGYRGGLALKAELLALEGVLPAAQHRPAGRDA
jgi:methylated-DNA-[protein]-cysteine S-methyltransferase